MVSFFLMVFFWNFHIIINIHIIVICFIISSYGDSWINLLKLHESIGENRVKFAAAIQEISEDVTTLYKETDRTRKNVRSFDLFALVIYI
jgi:hypothetical protein